MKTVDALKSELKVTYCIPEWLRDEQVKMNCARFKERIQRGKETNAEPIALVCFGPSLNETWEKVKDFKTIISCSGSHKFLMDRGITPTYHVEVDPRPHKIKLIGDNISTDTTFLMASCVSPDVFDHLEKHNAKIVLWHTYSGEKKDILPNVYPRGEWVSTGGANVGLRAMVLARILGHTNIHIFGMDGSFPEEGLRHAADHPNRPKDHILAEFNGKQYCTTTAFLSCARSTVHELEMLPDVDVTFYGEGLIQDMVKSSALNKKKKASIAFFLSPTISKEYIEQNRILHQENPAYGVSVLQHLETIKELYKVTESRSLLDYGCGKGLLAKNLDFPIWEYDPAIAGKDSPPRAADLVTCIDVLEHIEPEYLPSVLQDLARCVKKVGFFVIATKAAGKCLPDGRNTHLIQQGREWWKEKLEDFFSVQDAGVKEKLSKLYVIVSPKMESTKDNELILIKQEALVCP